MKTALVTMAKMEEPYIIEYIEYYKQLGVDKIFIGDNNDIEYEYQLSDICKKYINDGFVELTDIRGERGKQSEFNTFIYRREKDNYDWFLYFDVDEYFTIKLGKTLHDFLSNKVYDNFNVIWINRREYVDDELVYYDDRPVQERFRKHVAHGADMIKSIIRGGIKNLVVSIHGVSTETGIRRCDVFGNVVSFEKPECNCDDMINRYGEEYLEMCFNRAELKHYMTKTIEEFYKHKLLRGRAPKFTPRDTYRYAFSSYFVLNKKTKERMDYVKSVEKEAERFIEEYKENYKKWYEEHKE